MVKEKKKKYKIGTCFGCQKYLYCGINLEKDICKCKKTVKPTRTNRTVQVKTAYPRMFNPTSSNHKQFNFIKSKNECFQYGYDFKKNIQLSFCSTCNSSYQRLSSKNSNSSNKSNLTEGTENTEEKETGGTKGTDIAKIIDLEATSSEISTTIIQSESKYNNSETENESDAELELEVNYKLVIKQADGTVLPAKNYSVTISELDEIAKNVTELRKETWCPMHNRHCLKDCESHTEISNMMFSTWATEMLNGLATVKEPPTHPSFAYTHPPKNRSQSIIPQFSNNIQDSINPFFSNILQALVTPHFFQPPQSQQSFQQPPLQPSFQQTSSHPSSQQTIPSMAEFLHQIDEIEKTEDYYFKFLEGFEKQRIKVKHLNKLNDAQFEACGVIAIGDVETISEAAQNYK
ncbi:19663_t:CDS:2 [Rhizophagus irregularis]|nr:19663_t:CDS:2 [Rhizophagus irregularis]